MAEWPIRASQQIERQLLTMLGKWWEVGAKLPPTPELARRLGTGQRNTHLAVRALAGKGFLLSKPGLGTFVLRSAADAGVPDHDSSSPGAAAHRPLAGKKIFAVLPLHPYRREQARWFIEPLQRAGAHVQPFEANETSNDLRRYCGAGVDGLALINGGTVSPVFFDERLPLAMVSCSRVTSIIATENFDMVAVDEEQGCILAGRMARRAGAVRACFVGAVDQVTQNEYSELDALRLRSFEYGLGARVAESRRLRILRYGMGSGAQAAKMFAQLRPLPDVVFATCDDVAIGLMMGVSALGLEIGRDFQLLGFDGMPTPETVEGGPLATIRRPDREILELAADCLIERLTSPGLPARRFLMACTYQPGKTLNVPAGEPTAVSSLD